jgi:HEAT repeat protein
MIRSSWFGQEYVMEITQESQNLESLISTLADNKAYEAAMKALVQIGIPAIHALIKALSNETPEIRAYSARTIGEISRITGNTDGVEPLILELHDPYSQAGHQVSQVFWIRLEAVEALARIGTAQAIQGLLEARSQVDSWTIKHVDEVFAEIDNPEAVKTLIATVRKVKPATSHYDGTLRINAAHSLGIIGDKRAVMPLCGMLTSPTPIIFCAAAEALGNIGDERALSPLQMLLAGPARTHEEWRSIVASAIGKINVVKMRKLSSR